MNKKSVLLIIYDIFLLGYIFNRGFYTFSGVLIISLVLIFLVLYLTDRLRLVASIDNFNFFLKFSVLISMSLALVLYGGLYQNNQTMIVLSRTLLFVAIIVAFFYLLRPPISLFAYIKNKFLVLVVIAIVLRFLMMLSSPAPAIDVFFVLKEGPLALFHNLTNPYAIDFTPVYRNIKPDTFGYLPGVIYLALIPDLLFGDPRVGLLIAELVFVYLLFKIVKKKEEAQLFGLLILYHPSVLFILEQSWVDIFFVSLLAGYLVACNTKFNQFLRGFLLGCAVLVKLSYILLPIFIIRSVYFKKKQWIGFAVAIVVIALPFILWSPSAFINDILLPYSDPARNAASLTHSLNLNAFSVQNFNFAIPLFTRTAIVVVVIALLLLWQKKSTTSSLVAFVASLIALYLFGDQAFVNYYYAVSMLLILALVTVSKPSNSEKV